METLQTVVDVLKRESADAADLSSLEARMSRLQAEAEEQAVQLQAARLTINTEAARNNELRQQIGSLGKQRLHKRKCQLSIPDPNFPS
jgi:chromosome segregation ATPase